MKHLLSISQLKKEDILRIIDKAIYIKKNPKKFSTTMYEKTLLMIFEVPSLRTRISFDVAMTQMGGHAINYTTEHSPWGHGKETVEDTARTISRYCNLVTIRMHSHKDVERFAENSAIPVINSLTSFEHPCQILGDLMTIMEIKKRLDNLKISYLGDGNNNITHSLIYACSIIGLKISVACPKIKDYYPQEKVLHESSMYSKFSNSEILIIDKADEAVKDADVIYADSWMSYRIPKSQLKTRLKIFKPYRVTSNLLMGAKQDYIFMHCLPASREQEVSADVIDGSHSIIWQQAENRLHIQKAIMLWCLGKI